MWARRKVKIEIVKISMVRGLKQLHYCSEGKEVSSMKLQCWPLGFIGMLNAIGIMLANFGDAKGAFGFIEELWNATKSTITLLLDTGCDKITDAK